MTSKGYWGFALLVCGVLAMAGIAALPYAWAAAQEDALAEKRLELRFMEAKLKNAKSGPKQQLSMSDEIGTLFVSGSTPGLAIAQMQGVASQLATQSGMTVERLQPLQTDREGQLAVLRIEAEVTGSLEGLRGYLAALDTAVPFFFINRMKVEAPEATALEGGALPSDQLTVTLQLESFGWWEAQK
jgi:hypothetical protein